MLFIYVAALSVVFLAQSGVTAFIQAPAKRASRTRATWFSAAVIFVIGLPAATNLQVLGAMDALFGGVLLIAGGLLIAVLMGWVVPQTFLADLKDSEVTQPSTSGLILFFLRWVSPAVIAVGLLISVVDLIRNWTGQG